MKKFQFSLATLLEVLRNQENLAYKSLLEAQLVLTKTCESLENLEKKRNALINTIHSEQKSPSTVSTLANQYEFFQFLEKRIKNHEILVQHAQIEMDTRREKLTTAVQKRKMMENLQEKKYNEWDYNLQEKERTFFDDLATIRFLRDKQLRK